MGEAETAIRKEIDRLTLVRDGLSDTFNEIEGILTNDARSAFNLIINELSREIIQLTQDADSAQKRGD